jgi:hypothetical protein
LLDETLKQLLTKIPDPHPTDAEVPAEVAAQIHEAVQLAWPNGHPPTLDELAAEDTDEWGRAHPADPSDHGILGFAAAPPDHGIIHPDDEIHEFGHEGDLASEHNVPFGDHTDSPGDHPSFGDHDYGSDGPF